MKSGENPPFSLSVLMAVKNGGDYLKATVESVLRQTFGDFEFVIIEDAGDDGSYEYLASLSDTRLRLYRNETSLGLAGALNRGLAVCRSEWVARVDHDDVCAPDRLEAQMRFVERRPDLAVLGTWCRLVDKSGAVFSFYEPPTDLPEIAACFCRVVNPVMHPSVLMHRVAVLDAGGYADLPFAQDYDLWCRLLLRGKKIANIPEHLVDYRVHAGQISRRKWDDQAKIADAVTADYLSSLLPSAERADLSEMIPLLKTHRPAEALENAPEKIRALASSVPEALCRYFGWDNETEETVRRVIFNEDRPPEIPESFEREVVVTDRQTLWTPCDSDFTLSSDFVAGLVSVVVPCLNGERYVAGAVRSALEQTYKNIEILVIDNGSADRSLEIARSFGPPVRVFVESKRGLPNARNRALREAKGEFIQLLDCDDLIHPSKFEKQIAMLRADPALGMVYSGSMFFSDSIFGDLKPVDFLRGAKDFLTAFLAHNLLPPVAALYTRKVLEAVGPFDPALPAAEDWDYWFRAALAGFGFAYDPEVLCYYRRHEGQMTQTSDIMVRGIRLLLEKMERMMPPDAWTPARLQAFIRAYFVDVLTRWKMADRSSAGHREVEEKILSLVERAEAAGGLFDVRDSELIRVEEVTLPIRLALLTKKNGRGDADRLLEYGIGRVEQLLRDPSFPEKDLPALNSLIQQFYGEAGILEQDMGVFRFRHLIQSLIDRFGQDVLPQQFPSLGMDRLIEPVVKTVLAKGGTCVGLYGAGLHTARILGLADLGIVNLQGVKIVGIVDDNPASHGKKLFGVPVMSAADLIALSPDAVILSSDRFEYELWEKSKPLRDAGIAVLKIYGDSEIKK